MTEYKPIKQFIDNLGSNLTNDIIEHTNNEDNKNNTNNPTPFYSSPPPPFPPTSSTSYEMNNMNNQGASSSTSQAEQDLQSQKIHPQPQPCSPEASKITFCFGVSCILFFFSTIMLTAGENKYVRVWGLLGIIIGVFLLFIAGCIVFEVHDIYGNKKFLKFVGFGFLGTILISIGVMLAFLKLV
ncbi:uncharacterized protein KGF55_004943 [Candida pseudojiufengensis]|uniref:uncharacterized protein n=1 Tax=Candida pseudojiufengensis TaxID=497109 RepID=UPI002224725A|nr:uncharacterized protein KGF55_004943 [Candida pseudojiufengensis]KAI5959711.1 hypothetical protein KGF55_004943 [Candida pseudojiufengensis]